MGYVVLLPLQYFVGFDIQVMVDDRPAPLRGMALTHGVLQLWCRQLVLGYMMNVAPPPFDRWIPLASVQAEGVGTFVCPQPIPYSAELTGLADDTSKKANSSTRLHLAAMVILYLRDTIQGQGYVNRYYDSGTWYKCG